MHAEITGFSDPRHEKGKFLFDMTYRPENGEPGQREQATCEAPVIWIRGGDKQRINPRPEEFQAFLLRFLDLRQEQEEIDLATDPESRDDALRDYLRTRHGLAQGSTATLEGHPRITRLRDLQESELPAWTETWENPVEESPQPQIPLF